MNYSIKLHLTKQVISAYSKLFCSVLFCSVLFCFSANAQNEPCQDCVPISTSKKIVKVLCGALVTLPGNQNPTPYPDAVWVELDYIETMCDNRIVIELRSFTLHTPIFNYMDLSWPYVVSCDPIVPISPPPPHPLDINNWGEWNLWIHQVTEALLPPSVGPRVIRFPAGCKAIAKIKWPTGAVIYHPLGDGGGYTTLPLNETIQLVDCGGGCCEVEMHKDDNTLQINTIRQVFNCGNPAPVNTTLTVQNPTTGDITTYTASEVVVTVCKPMCLEQYPTGMFTSDNQRKLIKDESFIVVKPTIFNDFIYFETNNKIQKVLLTDTRGATLYHGIIDSNKLALPNLSKGIYIVHVYMENGIMKTFKIIKE